MAEMRFLTHYLDFIFPPSEDELLIRKETVSTLEARYAIARIERTAPHTTALLPFSDPCVRALVHGAKYHKNKRAIRLLGHALSFLLKNLSLPPHTIIVPIPLSKKRYRERGHNQVLSVLFHTTLPNGVSVESNLLKKRFDTESQVGKKRENRKELPGDIFVVTEPLQGKTVILLDDVVTSGTTLQRGIDALKMAGIKRVIPLALAYK